ncbi:MAG: TSUP family transporter [Anaerolineales bacterium]
MSTLLPLSPAAFVVALTIVLVAAFVQSLTGFGFALVSVPILVLILDPKAIVPVTLILGAGLNALALSANKRARKIDMLNKWLLGGALIGIPFGAYLLGRLDPNSLRLLVGIAGAGIGIAIARGYSVHIRRPRLSALTVGLLSGALNASTSMGGGPVALYLAHLRSDKDDFRTNLLLYILLANLAAILLLIAADLMEPNALRLSLWLTPAVLVGFGLGHWLFSRLSTSLFTQIVVYVVVLTSAVGALMVLLG